MKKKLLIFVVGIILVISLIGIIYILVFKQKNTTVKPKVKIVDYDRSDHVGPPNEETVLKEYNLSKEEAIQIIKSRYNAGSYKFIAKVNYESHYIIKVTHPDLEEAVYWDIDPSTKEARLLNKNEK